MNIIGEIVTHNAFGEGTVISVDRNIIHVDFSGTIRSFKYPEAFERYLTANNKEIQNQLLRLKNNKKEEKTTVNQQKKYPTDANVEGKSVKNNRSDNKSDNQFFGYDFNEGKVRKIYSKKSIKEIIDMFPKERISDMTIDEYCISPTGTGNDNSFCHLLRYQKYICSMGNAFPATFEIYKDKNGVLKMSKSFQNLFEDDFAGAFKEVKARIIKFLNAAGKRNTNLMNSIKLNTAFKMKLASVYYPDVYFPVATKEYLRQACYRLGVIYDEGNLFNSMIYLVEWKDRFDETKEFIPAEIMWYVNYLIRNDYSMTDISIGGNPYKRDRW